MRPRRTPHAAQPPWLLRCSFAKMHGKCARENRLAVVTVAGAGAGESGRVQEYLLAALWGRLAGVQDRHPVFAAFAASHYSGDFLLIHMLQPRRLPVIWDLDDTLLVARSQSSLEKEAKAVQERRTAAGGDARTLHRLQLEGQMIDADRAMLRSFAERDAVTIASQQFGAVLVEANMTVTRPGREGGKEEEVLLDIQRPVIPVPDGSAVFTRILPQDRATSMLFRLRPNWAHGVWPRLAGFIDASGRTSAKAAPLFETFVCTTAEANYAREAWRVLDAGGVLIPKDKCEQLL